MKWYILKLNPHTKEQLLKEQYFLLNYFLRFREPASVAQQADSIRRDFNA